MLARRMPGIAPEMTPEESLEVTRIYSVAGMLSGRAALVTARPFRSPHPGVSLAGLIGGGSGIARPGEVSLAHASRTFYENDRWSRRVGERFGLRPTRHVAATEISPDENSGGVCGIRSHPVRAPRQGPVHVDPSPCAERLPMLMVFSSLGAETSC
jgi:hypothetical protein